MSIAKKFIEVPRRKWQLPFKWEEMSYLIGKSVVKKVYEEYPMNPSRTMCGVKWTTRRFVPEDYIILVPDDLIESADCVDRWLGPEKAWKFVTDCTRFIGEKA